MIVHLLTVWRRAAASTLSTMSQNISRKMAETEDLLYHITLHVFKHLPHSTYINFVIHLPPHASTSHLPHFRKTNIRLQFIYLMPRQLTWIFPVPRLNTSAMTIPHRDSQGGTHMIAGSLFNCLVLECTHLTCGHLCSAVSQPRLLR